MCGFVGLIVGRLGNFTFVRRKKDWLVGKLSCSVAIYNILVYTRLKIKGITIPIHKGRRRESSHMPERFRVGPVSRRDSGGSVGCRPGPGAWSAPPL